MVITARGRNFANRRYSIDLTRIKTPPLRRGFCYHLWLVRNYVMILTPEACKPFGPRSTSNVTFCPSLSVRNPSD